ncbi:hypothetical protein L9F63_009867, partial [Diploptera punctata]
MLEAINGLQHVMQQAAHFLLSPPQVSYQPNSEFVYFDLDDMRKHHYSIPEKTVVFVGEGLETQRIIIYNSLTWRRQELVTIRVSTLHVKVTDAADISIPSQTSPVFQQQSDTIIDSQFDITFMADVPALGLTTYFLNAVLPAQNIENSLSHVKLINFVGRTPRAEGFDDIEVMEEPKEFAIHNDHLSAAFSELGLLKAVTLKDSGVTVPLHMDFVRYHARPGSERSGAYLFLPDREAETVVGDSVPVRVLEGPLFSQVHVHLPNVQHTVTLVNTPGADSLGLEVQNVVNIGDQVNCELAMRISSSIKNGDEFFSDLNGWQLIRRKRFSKLPIQANYYPIPTMAFIQDQNYRFTIVTGQPLGMGSLKEGQIEVMQDRRLNQDDNRGLGQGVTDNRPLPATFRLIVEKRVPNCQETSPEHPGGLPTMAANVASLSLLHPLYHLLWLGKTRDKLGSQFTPVIHEPGYDFHVVMLQTFSPQSSNSAGLIVHRQETDSCFPLENFFISSGLLNVSNLLPTQFGNIMKESTLSFLDEGRTIKKNTAHPLALDDNHMLYSFQLILFLLLNHILSNEHAHQECPSMASSASPCLPAVLPTFSLPPSAATWWAASCTPGLQPAIYRAVTRSAPTTLTLTMVVEPGANKTSEHALTWYRSEPFTMASTSNSLEPSPVLSLKSRVQVTGSLLGETPAWRNFSSTPRKMRAACSSTADCRRPAWNLP